MQPASKSEAAHANYADPTQGDITHDNGEEEKYGSILEEITEEEIVCIGIRYTLFRPLYSSHSLAQTYQLSKPISLVKANHSGITFDQAYANENIFIRI